MSGSNLSKARQQKAVGEGLAIGLLAIGVEAVTSDKQAVEWAFRKAWRDWSGRALFPQVRIEVARHDLLAILHDSPRRRGPLMASWSCGRWLEPELHVDWELGEAAEIASDGTGVTLERWSALARALVDELKDEEVRRTG